MGMSTYLTSILIAPKTSFFLPGLKVSLIMKAVCDILYTTCVCVRFFSVEKSPFSTFRSGGRCPMFSKFQRGAWRGERQRVQDNFIGLIRQLSINRLIVHHILVSYFSP